MVTPLSRSLLDTVATSVPVEPDRVTWMPLIDISRTPSCPLNCTPPVTPTEKLSPSPVPAALGKVNPAVLEKLPAELKERASLTGEVEGVLITVHRKRDEQN